MHRVWAIVAAVFALALVSSCGTAPQQGEEVGEKIPAEAYLFDAKLQRDGKPTSFRLELLHADSVMAIAGRGYLGKAGLKGRATADSLFVFFPTENSFVYEPVANLLHSLECGLRPTGLNLLELFRQRPDSIHFDSAISLTSNPHDPDKPSFLVFITDCPWQIELTYDFRQGAGWRVREFSFFDGKRTHLSAMRREFKAHAAAKPSKFVVRIPRSAERIAP